MKVVSKKEAESLPEVKDPEERAKNADRLAEFSEERWKDRIPIDPEKLKPDREIQGQFEKNQDRPFDPNARYDPTAVSGKVPGYHYSWVSPANNGTFINAMKFWGWEVVNGEMPEAKEYENVSGQRQLGDTILVRIPQERFQQLEKRDRMKRLKRKAAAEADLYGHKKHPAIIVRVGPEALNRMGKAHLAKQLADAKIQDMLRSGSLTGMEIGG